jgi:Na+-driven multidrug efflux pump
MFAIGIPSFISSVATSISSMILLSSVVKYGGDIALSAFGIVQRFLMFANIPANVIGQGLQPILGYNYGARRFRLGVKAIYTAYAAATVLSVALFVLLYTFPGPLAKIFRDDPEFINMYIYAARLCFLGMPLFGLVMVGQMIFQAIGKAIPAFILAIVRPVAFLIPTLLIMSHFWKLDGVFLSLPASDFLTFILIIVLLAPVIGELRKAAAREQKDNISLPVTETLPDDAESSS